MSDPKALVRSMRAKIVDLTNEISQARSDGRDQSEIDRLESQHELLVKLLGDGGYGPG